MESIRKAMGDKEMAANLERIHNLYLDREEKPVEKADTYFLIREVFKKSKWKFKMAFAMKGGGTRGGLECHIPILKNDFLKKTFRIIP